MSKSLDELGGKCPYMPFLDRGQMSEGEHVRPPFVSHVVPILISLQAYSNSFGFKK